MPSYEVRLYIVALDTLNHSFFSVEVILKTCVQTGFKAFTKMKKLFRKPLATEVVKIGHPLTSFLGGWGN